MKKTLLLLASAALLLVGCAKEQLSNGVDGGMTSVTFSASVDGGVATKAAAYNDGNGAYVNRCIMEIYFQNELYTRLVQPVTPAAGEAKAYATFANVPVVAGKEYQILFWADCGGAEKSDLYYTTTSLKAVTVAKTAFIGALVAGDNDKLDAFFFAETRSIPQSGDNSYTVSLKRPFAQLNVITTDINKTVTSAALLPDKVSVSYKADNILNVATGETSRSETEADYTFTYEAPVYGVWSDTKSELTLSMDYILASTDKSAIDVTFITKNGSQAVVTHNLTNLPYQRNYRTNVKGDLLTTNGSWKAEIDPEWAQPDIVKVVEVADIKSANEIINQYKETTDHLEVKFTGEPSDSGEPAGESAGIRAIVTTPIKEGNTLSIEVLTETKKLYIGDYKNEYIVSGEDFIDTDNSKHAVVNVNVPEESSITTLVINAPSKSVYINGKEVANVGTITDLDAITSQNTLIIEKGQTVNKLTIRQGGLEIHGKVTTLEITENAHSTNPVKVRTSENLSQTVFDVIYKEGEGGHDYIDRPDFSEKQNADGSWDIVPSVCKIGETAYGSLNNAVAAIPSGGSGEIIMISNSSLEKAVTIPSDKTVILELNGKTINYILDNAKWTALITNRGSLTIKDATDVDCNGSGTGMIAAEALSPDLRPTPGYASNTINNLGSLTVKSGSIVNFTEEGAACYPIDNNSNERPVTLVIDGGRLFRENSNALRVVCFDPNNLNKVTVNGGIIEGGYSGVWVQLPGNDPNTKPLCSVEINGGVFKGTYPVYDYSYGNSFENTKYVINGGQFIGGLVLINYGNNSPADVSINGGYFSDFYTYANSNKKVIKGGYFEYSDYYFTYCVADGYDIIANTDPATKDKYPWKVIEDVKPVDLGLSVIWGDRNVNAASVFEKGDYFAWGETVARADAGDWGSYKYYDESSNTVTKYNTTDQIYVLKQEDDAASVNLGDGWRMPTKAEMEELLNGCTYAKTSNYQGSGVNGLLFTAQNGQTLFIPASGNIWDQLYNPTTEVCFWCADKPTIGSAKAYALDYISSLIDKDTGFSRCGLMPIRPVKSK